MDPKKTDVIEWGGLTFHKQPQDGAIYTIYTYKCGRWTIVYWHWCSHPWRVRWSPGIEAPLCDVAGPHATTLKGAWTGFRTLFNEMMADCPEEQV